MTAMVTTTLLLALAWFTVVNAVVSLVSWTAAAWLQRKERPVPAAALLWIRLFPASLSLLLSGLVFIPSHWATESRDANETFGSVLYLFAWVGGVLIARSAARAFALARADRRLRRRERRSALAPGLREVEGLPGLALAGVLRTRILVGPAVPEHLSHAELEVAMAHEIAHRKAFDNLKRWAIQCAPDFLGWTRVARQTERDWHAAAESLADARAVRQDAQRALNLAAALVKVARLTIAVPGFPSTPVWSALNDPALLEDRVRRLAREPLAAAPARPVRAAAAALLLACATISLVPVVAGQVHQITELVVAFLA